MQAPASHIYTVHQLNTEVKSILEGQLGRIQLTGEISNLTMPYSGHWYLTLKDEAAQIRCVMFKGKNQLLNFKPSNGQQVLVRGSISVYEPRGDYQLIIDAMKPAGEGLLALEYERLKMKLAAEGLFAQGVKRELPKQIQKIGVITSPSGAAIRDVLHVLNRRDASVEVVIYPTQVQGATAAEQIIQAIEIANQRLEVEVLLLTRGGGSLEDLWCFNDENLAHAIYNSRLPTISAVGHEIDHSIADYVADLRAPTPSAAAEILSKDKGNKAEKIVLMQQQLTAAMAHYLLKAKQKQQQLEARLRQRHPERLLNALGQRFDDQGYRLQRAMERLLTRQQQQHTQLSARLSNQSPSHRLHLMQQQLSYQNKRLLEAMPLLLKQQQTQLAHLAHNLNNVSPLATLSRGYSISLQQGQVITDSAQLSVGDQITTKLAHGEFDAQVTEIRKKTA